MTVVAALSDLKKYTQKKYNANISTTIFKLHRYSIHIELSSEGQVKVKSRKKSRRKREDLTSLTVLSLLHHHPPPPP